MEVSIKNIHQNRFISMPRCLKYINLHNLINNTSYMHTICTEPIQIGCPMQMCTYLTNILLELKRPIDVLTNFRGYYF